MSLCSEDTQRRQRVSCCWRSTTIWQVQVIETLHESLRHIADLFLRRLQSLAAQVLPTLQPYCVRAAKIAPTVHPLQQSALW